MSFNTTETFDFGDVSSAIASSPDVSSLINVARHRCSPCLPPGKAVELIDAYLVSFTAPFAVHAFSFDLIIHSATRDGDANSGECLDAQSWNFGNALLMVGTEDGESLKRRMPWLTVTRNTYPIEYLPNGFRMTISYIKPNQPVDFHFVLAYNRLESENDSEWFAADVPHCDIAAFPVVKRLAGNPAV